MNALPSSAPTAGSVVAALCAELEAGFLSGLPARAEDAIAALPPGSGVESAIDLIYAEYLARLEVNRVQLEEELCRRFPQWREELRRQFRLHDWLTETMVSEQEEKSAPTRETSALLTEVGPYRILGEAGRGGAGVVYRAARAGSDVEISLKVSRGSDQTRLAAEAALLARLRHPQIVRFVESGEADGRFYLALELVAGKTLADRIADEPIPPAVAARLIGLLACTVNYVHQQGFAHLDLTPGNVMITPGGSPKLIDFGSARTLTGDTVAPSTDAGSLGTPAYLAPEQVVGDDSRIGVRTDVYALGGLLYESLTGRRPFFAGTMLETFHLIRTAELIQPRALRPDIPPGLEAICLKCLSKNPTERYATTRDCASALLAHATNL